MTKLISMFVAAAFAPQALAFVCYQSELEPGSVRGLKTAGMLNLLAPTRAADRVGAIQITAAGVDAENNVLRSAGPPEMFTLGSDSGTFQTMVIDGATHLLVDDGMLAIKLIDDEGTVFVKRSSPTRPIAPHQYRVRTLTEAECLAAFPYQGR